MYIPDTHIKDTCIIYDLLLFGYFQKYPQERVMKRKTNRQKQHFTFVKSSSFKLYQKANRWHRNLENTADVFYKPYYYIFYNFTIKIIQY